MASKKYTSMIYVAHSFLEMEKHHLIFNKSSTVDDFRESKVNNKICLEIGKQIEEKFEYELSWNQMSNSIFLFISSRNL